MIISKNFHHSKFHNEENVEIYKDTLLKATQYRTGKTELFRLADHASGNEPIRQGNIKVIEADSVSAMTIYANTKVAVLNMASAKRPGGGVASGSKAQEESLFRCSNLGLSISQEFYPLREDEFLYTKDAVFFKDVRYNDMEFAIEADVITCAAINLNDNAIYGYFGREVNSENVLDDPQYIMLTNRKIQSIITIAIKHGIENLILGAWGCGVFKNDPNFIAQTFYDNLICNDRYKHFDNVVFALINDKNSTSNNVEAFKKHVKEIKN